MASASATNFRGWLMPKALCLTGLVVAGLIFLIFFIDLLLGLIGMKSMSPFGLVSMTMDITFIIGSLLLGFLGWSTLREQK